MKKPDSIIRIDSSILNGVDHYEAFVYSYTHVGVGKTYVGSHLGNLGDGYWQSSRNPEFLDLFSGLTPVFDYKIVAIGSYDEMKNLESKIHKDEKVVSNPMYYNLGAAGAAFKLPVRVSFIEDFVLPKILAGDFNVPDKWSKSVLLDRSHTGKIKVKALQVRFEDNKLITEIANRIALKGDTADCERTTLVELGDGWYLIIDGNSTLEAIRNNGNVTQHRVRIIPKEFIDHYGINEDELRHIGHLLNPGQETIKQETTDDDLIKTLQKFYMDSEGKIKFNSPYSLQYIYSVKKCSPQKATAIAKKAKKEYLEKNRIYSGKKVIDYDSSRNPRNYVKVEERVKELEDDNSIVVSYSSGAPKTLSLNIIDAINAQPTRHRIIAVIYHNEDDNQKNWEKKNRSIVKNRIESILGREIPLDGIKDVNGIIRNGVKKEFRFVEMPHEESDIS